MVMQKNLHRFTGNDTEQEQSSELNGVLCACRQLVEINNQYKDEDQSKWDGNKFSDMHDKWASAVLDVIKETEKLGT